MFMLLGAVASQLGVPTLAGAAIMSIGAVTRFRRSQKRDVVVPLDTPDGQQLAVGHMVSPEDLARPQYAKAKAVLQQQVSQGMEVHPSVMAVLRS
jgi:hypothetical protein